MAVLIVDKPEGPSSFAVLRRVAGLVSRSLLGPKGGAPRRLKCGHGGTLDPFASGVLPICFGEATKLAGFLLDADKEYEATVRFGVATDSHDLTGTVIATGPIDSLSEALLRRLLATFVGEMEQVPPMHSALKHRGRPLYAYAREGTEIERQPRKVRIHEIDLLAWQPPDVARVRLRCSKGTYVRVLAVDLGRAAGTEAHLVALRRTASGNFGIAGAIGLPEIEARVDRGEGLPMVSLARALAHLPGARAGALAAAALLQGQRVAASAVGLSDGTRGRVRVLREDETLLAVADVTADGAQPVRIFAPDHL
jgi:tRNA pseudouridine55 synthase